MKRRAFAWLNLAWHTGRHMARMPLRALEGEDDAERFLDAVVPEGYVPLSADERAAYPSFTDCISCGLCSLACPALRDAPGSTWDEAWAFVIGPSRQIDEAPLVSEHLSPCTRCGECALVCPVDIPIPEMAAMIERLADVERERIDRVAG